METIRLKLANIVYRIFLWLSDQTNDEFVSMLLEDAEREIKSERMNNWLLK